MHPKLTKSIYTTIATLLIVTGFHALLRMLVTDASRINLVLLFLEACFAVCVFAAVWNRTRVSVDSHATTIVTASDPNDWEHRG